MMLASVSRRSALVVASKRYPACLSLTVRSMSTQEQKDQDNILPVSIFFDTTKMESLPRFTMCLVLPPLHAFFSSSLLLLILLFLL